MHIQAHACSYSFHNSALLFLRCCLPSKRSQENQASQQKSLSSPKKEPLSSRRMTVLIGTSRIVKWASPAPFASQSPSSRCRSLLRPCCCGTNGRDVPEPARSDITHTQALRSRPRSTAAPFQQNLSNPTMVESGQGHRAWSQGTAVGMSHVMKRAAGK